MLLCGYLTHPFLDAAGLAQRSFCSWNTVSDTAVTFAEAPQLSTHFLGKKAKASWSEYTASTRRNKIKAPHTKTCESPSKPILIFITCIVVCVSVSQETQEKTWAVFPPPHESTHPVWILVFRSLWCFSAFQWILLKVQESEYIYMWTGRRS